MTPRPSSSNPVRALVTGAARGIGRAIALRLARDAQLAGGARLTLADVHEAELRTLAEALQAMGSRANVVAGDLGDPEVPGRLVASALEAFGGLDALVSNAGIAKPSPLAACATEDWDRVFAVNTRAPFLLGRAAHAALRTSRGAMVVVTSISGTHATSPLGAYSASKAATLMLVRQMAGEWGPDGIRVNALSPGLIVTPGTTAAYADPAVREQREQRVPLHRLGTPEDMAAVAAFLLGPDAAYVTGAELLADGGLAQTLMSSLPMGGWQAQIAATPQAASRLPPLSPSAGGGRTQRPGEAGSAGALD
ncbi:MAG: SDR family oxidoreductase [Variovorax sp.]|nr:SDR family oxidoreductase [Variovorax sp.]